MAPGIIVNILQQWSRLRTHVFTLLLGSQFRSFGRGSRITPPFRFSGLHRMSLGENVIIAPDCWIQTVGANVENTVKLVIGAHCSIGMGASISAAKLVILGERVLLARNVYISDHIHGYADVSQPVQNQPIDKIKPISIGKGAWLGQNVCVLPGASIGEHCIIGANSVVNSSIPDFCVAAGAPARVIKRYNGATAQWETVRKSSN